MNYPDDQCRKRDATIVALTEAALKYDDAIRACANDPSRMASFCTATGEDLDTLYLEWMTKAPGGGGGARGVRA